MSLYVVNIHGDIEGDYEIVRKYKEQESVLDKIRAEIHATAEMHEDGNYYLRDEWIDEIFDNYKAGGGRMSRTHNLDGLKTQALECIEAAYDKGYKNGLKDGNINDGTFAAKIKEAYDNGLNDAWECVGKMERLLFSDVFSNVFGNTDFYTVVTKMSASEAMTKIKEYEEIHVGDEDRSQVFHCRNVRGVKK